MRLEPPNGILETLRAERVGIVVLEDSSIKMNNVIEARLQDSLKTVALVQSDSRKICIPISVIMLYKIHETWI
jgi:hypothetical protein